MLADVCSLYWAALADLCWQCFQQVSYLMYIFWSVEIERKCRQERNESRYTRALIYPFAKVPQFCRGNRYAGPFPLEISPLPHQLKAMTSQFLIPNAIPFAPTQHVMVSSPWPRTRPIISTFVRLVESWATPHFTSDSTNSLHTGRPDKSAYQLAFLSRKNDLLHQAEMIPTQYQIFLPTGLVRLCRWAN